MSEQQIVGFENYLKSKSPRTATAYGRDAKRFFDFIKKDISQITPLDISLWFNERRTIYGDGERSINRYGWSLRKFFALVGRRDLAEMIETPTYVAPMPKWQTEDKIDQLLSNATEDAMPVLTTAYDLALRVGEVTLLQKAFFNPDTLQIKVWRLKHKGHPNEYILPISKDVAELLTKYLEDHKSRDPRIFPMSTEMVTYHYRQTCKKAGIDSSEYTFHSLRHSKITHLALQMIKEEGRVDEVRLAKFAGHLKYETTLLYVHLASEYLAFKK
jgi:integrase